MKNYDYLCNLIYESFNNGDIILLHCEQGLIRSATLLLYFLRKYYFKNIDEANEFISLKKMIPESPKIFVSMIEKIID